MNPRPTRKISSTRRPWYGLRPGTKIVVGLSLLLTCFRFASDTTAATSPASESQVKAAFLFNFPKYITWPEKTFAATNSPIIFGVLGKDQTGDDLKDLIDGKTIGGRPLVFKRVDTSQELNACHILFICPSEKKRLVELPEKLKGACVLTVSETDAFPQAGGIINFCRRENKIRIQINRDAAEKARLKISSRLLNVAEVVESGAREKEK